MQSYGNYPYYGQPMYQQQPQYMTGPSNPYPHFSYPPHPSNPHVPTYQDNRDAPFIPPSSGGATPRPKGHRRMATTPATSKLPPLKSAMKKTVTAPLSGEGLTRQTTYPPIYPQQVSRPRMYTSGNLVPLADPNQDFRPRSSHFLSPEFLFSHPFCTSSHVHGIRRQ